MIWIPWHDGLGDLWASTSYLLGLSAREGGPVWVQRVKGDLCKQIASQLDSPGRLLFTDEPGVELEGGYIWHAPYAPTYARWHPHHPHQHYCYQFDGQSIPEQKNPPPADAECILQRAEVTSGLPGIRLGKHLGLSRCVDLLAGAAFFVGCDSGISHIAHSVGVPTFLLRYQLDLHTCHHGKQYIECKGVHGFNDEIRNFYRCIAEIDPRRKK